MARRRVRSQGAAKRPFAENAATATLWTFSAFVSARWAARIVLGLTGLFSALMFRDANRAIENMVGHAGFRIEHLDKGYMRGPKAMTFMYEGCARPE